VIVRAALLAVVCALGLAGCAKDESHPGFASATCRTPPCGGGIDRRGFVPPEAGADSGEAVADSGDAGP
jgi:hypothetical protein